MSLRACAAGWVWGAAKATRAVPATTSHRRVMRRCNHIPATATTPARKARLTHRAVSAAIITVDARTARTTGNSGGQWT